MEARKVADEGGGPARRRRQNVAIVSGFVAQPIAAGRNRLLGFGYARGAQKPDGEQRLAR
jgi:hypothetical protein